MILKWTGGKLRVLPELKKRLPSSFNTYYEPFFGSGALYFSLSPKKAVINDVNESLMQLYKTVRDEPQKLISRLLKIEKEYLSFSEEKRKDFYYKKRDEYNKTNSILNKSTLFIFLNKTGFNGMYRENSRGEFNIPMGRYKNPRILFKDRILEASKKLQKTALQSTSYKSALKTAKKGDFIYLDPPYHPISKTSSFTAYSKDDFNEADQIELAKLYAELDKRGCLVMLSNSDSPLINELYGDFNIHKIDVGRAINSKVSGRGKVKEVIVTNY